MRKYQQLFNPLNAELNPICHMLALLGAHLILHVGRIRVKSQHHTTSQRCICSYDHYKTSDLLSYGNIVNTCCNLTVTCNIHGKIPAVFYELDRYLFAHTINTCFTTNYSKHCIVV